MALGRWLSPLVCIPLTDKGALCLNSEYSSGVTVVLAELVMMNRLDRITGIEYRQA